jgi:ABC-type transport system involved in multi-copper enzyme maturation permease subunit
MIWLTWRQFRTQTFATAAFLAAAAVYLLITGTQLRHSYTSDLASCTDQNSCFGVFNGLRDDYDGAMQITGLLVMAAPAVIGIFWGAPLIAGELERGTHYMAWNQSVTRNRWLAVKLAGTALASIVTAGLLSLLVTWWASPLDAIQGSRFGTEAFNGRNVAPLGYAAFAFALGVTAGLLVRRTLPAMAATLAIFLALQILMTGMVRPHLMPATTDTVAINQATMNEAIRFDRSPADTGPVHIDLPAPAGAWILSESPALNRTGAQVPTSAVLSCWSQFLGPSSPAGKGTSPGFGPLGGCLAAQNLHVDITYQPASRYWQLQWAETAVYTALAALLAAACFWRVRSLRG